MHNFKYLPLLVIEYIIFFILFAACVSLYFQFNQGDNSQIMMFFSFLAGFLIYLSARSQKIILKDFNQIEPIFIKTFKIFFAISALIMMIPLLSDHITYFIGYLFSTCMLMSIEVFKTIFNFISPTIFSKIEVAFIISPDSVRPFTSLLGTYFILGINAKEVIVQSKKVSSQFFHIYKEFKRKDEAK